MAGNTFYTRNASKSSKASNSHRSKEKRNDLPGLSYTQGSSIRNIFVPRGMLPVIGRDGYKTIVTHRIADGSASNRTIFQVENTNENDYFVDSDRLIPSKFVIKKPTIQNITKTNYTEHIDGIIYPNGDKVSLSDLNSSIISDLVSRLEDSLANFYEQIIVPINMRQHSEFRGYSVIRFSFDADSKSEASVIFPDGGITQVPNFSVFTEVYGNNGDFDKTTPYTDLQKFDAIEWVKASGPSGMYPDVTPTKSYDTSLFNGIIEPFNIRTEIYDLDTFSKTDPIKPNSATGALMPDIKNTNALSESLNPGSLKYEDIGNSKSPRGLLETEYVNQDSFSADPFYEKDKFVDQYIDEEIKAILGVVSLNPGIVPVGSVVLSTGYDGMAHDRISSALYRGRLR